MTLGYGEFKLNELTLNIELVDKIPDPYIFINRQNGYNIYEKTEVVGNDTHHYYLGKKSN